VHEIGKTPARQLQRLRIKRRGGIRAPTSVTVLTLSSSAAEKYGPIANRQSAAIGSLCGK
jgi:hypothetical protein